MISYLHVIKTLRGQLAIYLRPASVHMFIPIHLSQTSTVQKYYYGYVLDVWFYKNVDLGMLVWNASKTNPIYNKWTLELPQVMIVTLFLFLPDVKENSLTITAILGK